MFWKIPGTTIGTNFATPYTCIYVDRVEQSCLEMQDLQWLLWLRYIGHIFFIWTNGKEKLKSFTFLTLAMSPLRRLSHLQIFFLIFFETNSKPLYTQRQQIVTSTCITPPFIQKTLGVWFFEIIEIMESIDLK